MEAAQGAIANSSEVFEVVIGFSAESFPDGESSSLIEIVS